LILNASKKLFLEKGIEQTTIRNIAQDIEYSVGTIYVYFKDKNEIFHELHSLGFRHLSGEMKVLFSVADPLERIKALGRVYLKFGIENPEMYDLMFTLKAPMDYLESEHHAKWNEGKSAFDVLRHTIQECLDAGRFKGHEMESLSFMIWSVVHGMVALYISQRMKGVELLQPEEMVMKGYEEFVLMLDKN